MSPTGEPTPPASLPAGISGKSLLAALGIALGSAVVFFGAAVVVLLVLPDGRALVAPVLASAIFLQALSAFIGLVLVARRYRVARSALGLVRPSWRLLHALWQVPAAIVVLLLVQAVFLVGILGDPNAAASETNGSVDRLLANAGALTALFAFLGMAVLTPLWEELFFRGYLMGWLRGRFAGARSAGLRSLAVLLAIVLSAVAFAAVHLVPVLLPYLFALGLCAGYLRWFHRNLWGGVALHMCINTIASAAILAVLVG
ncbi:type II CAAX endopeptidase family protein [Brevibacterium samyangense]|uniref:CAAX prenyl protease 2/Lysostaphin resistance protein A-like domain-containing protein n=1 Tax=Brevibacterium samyangense TaxID=366888 RepID=A0ABP5EP30_9MICO